MYVYYVNNDIIILSMFTQLLPLTSIISRMRGASQSKLGKKVTYHPTECDSITDSKEFCNSCNGKTVISKFFLENHPWRVYKKQTTLSVNQVQEKRFYGVRILKSSTLSMKSSKKHEISHLLKSLVWVGA